VDKQNADMSFGSGASEFSVEFVLLNL